MTEPKRRITMTEDQVEDLLYRAAKKGSDDAIRETFTSLGVDISTDESRIKVQGDFAHLRKTRVYSERIATFSLAALITSIIGAVMTALWAGYQAVIRAGFHPPPGHG